MKFRLLVLVQIFAFLVAISLTFLPKDALAALTCTATTDKATINPNDSFSLTVNFSDNKPHAYTLDFVGGTINTAHPTYDPKKDPPTDFPTKTFTAPDYYFTNINIRKPDLRLATPFDSCQVNSRSTITPTGCTFDFNPKTVTSEPNITFTVSQTTQDVLYRAHVTGSPRSAWVASTATGAPVTLTVPTPTSAGTFSAGVEYGLPGGRGSGTCVAQSTAAVTTTLNKFIGGKNPCTDDQNNPIDCPTALGNIPTNATAFTGRILTIAITLAGGIALIIMVRGAIKILMAAGDPQKINDGRDLIVAAVAGLLFLIFSVLIIRFLGKDLLGIF